MHGTQDKFEPNIETGPDGRLFDRRVRQHMSDTPAAGDLIAGEALAAVRAASHGFRVTMDRWLERHGLSEGRMALLWRLQRVSTITLGELADEMNVSPRNVTGLVDHLERDGLVERMPDPDDRRAVRVKLATKGAAKLEEIRTEMAAARDHMVMGFTEEELAELRHLCLKLAVNMNERIKERELEKV
jgi:DNA-binding MarR family transcriptional regulator